ncbi:MAG TPA: S8 family serine peptidase, partial [Paludibacter sp.]|nr:S8 family serine peptidase [Paludibacter sp.]
MPSGKPEGIGFDSVQVETNKQHDENRYLNPWYIPFIESRLIKTVPQKFPVVIAIIDDGFNVTNSTLKPFLYQNSRDIINSFDDDANSYKDDFTGWDISDDDAAVNPPKDKLKEYYHGTYLSGIIIRVLKSCDGEKASTYFKILPVKAISDRERLTYIKDGYKAMEYALAMHADIVCCAWGSNVMKA